MRSRSRATEQAIVHIFQWARIERATGGENSTRGKPSDSAEKEMACAANITCLPLSSPRRSSAYQRETVVAQINNSFLASVIYDLQ